MINFNKFKQSLKDILTYKHPDDYSFIIPDTANNLKVQENSNLNISKDINENLNYMKSKYNSMISSDIIIREFTLNARGKQFSAFIFCIDGMVDSNLVNDFVLNPLMLKNRANSFEGEESRVISEINTNNITIRKVKKFNIEDYIDSCLIPQNSVSKVHSYSEIISGINSRKLRSFYRYY